MKQPRRMVVAGLNTAVEQVSFLHSGEELKFTQQDGKVTVYDLPEAAPDAVCTVLKFVCADDIEFMMAGTLLLLRDAGADIHMWNLANGHCGTVRHSREEIIRIRATEAREAARLAGAVSHGRAMRNFVTDPPREAWERPVALYHALPHGLRDDQGQLARPGLCGPAPVADRKRAMLACHRSQKEWLDVSQGMDAYLSEMDRMAAEVGRLSGRFAHAEGWRRYNPLGLAAKSFNPLTELLNRRVVARSGE